MVMLSKSEGNADAGKEYPPSNEQKNMPPMDQNLSADPTDDLPF